MYRLYKNFVPNNIKYRRLILLNYHVSILIHIVMDGNDGWQ